MSPGDQIKAFNTAAGMHLVNSVSVRDLKDRLEKTYSKEDLS